MSHIKLTFTGNSNKDFMQQVHKQIQANGLDKMIKKSQKDSDIRIMEIKVKLKQQNIPQSKGDNLIDIYV